MSNTPRTDAALEAGLKQFSQLPGDKSPLCYSNLFQECCNLERENADLLAALKSAAEILGQSPIGPSTASAAYKTLEIIDAAIKKAAQS
jgi:hypothetical protein